MNQRTNKSHLGIILLALSLCVGSALAAETSKSSDSKWKWPVSTEVPGSRYEATVPDTLDLADRAKISLNCLTGALDPESDYEIYFYTRFRANPPFMYHDRTGLAANNSKFAESMPMMRVMCGSNFNREIETRMMESLVSTSGEDGMHYVLKGNRPWHGAKEGFACVYDNVRFLLAMKAWYHTTGDRVWLARIDRVVNRLDEIAIEKDDYVYYPTSFIGDWFSYGRKTGWLNTDEPAGHPTVLYVGPVLRGLAQADQVSSNPRGRELAEKLCRFVRKPVHWQPEVAPKFVDGPSRAQWSFHFHGWVAALRGLLDYAEMTGHADLKEFVRDGYDCARLYGIPRIGFFPELTTDARKCETCCIADMVALAIKLSDYGVGDYWDDVDRYVRNQLVEQQYVDADLLHKCTVGTPEHKVDSPRETGDRVIDRNLGGFTGWAWVTHDSHAPKKPSPNPNSRTGPDQIMQCCTGNGTQALYYAWDSIIRFSNGVAQINLLLNRASPWIDIDSYLPYEGKVVLRNKKAETVCVRIPRWVDRSKVAVHRGGKAVEPAWSGSNLVCTGLGPDEVVTITFPVQDRVEKAVLYGKEYTFHFRGNTVVDVEPKDRPARCYPFYERDHMKANKAPMKSKQRFVSDVIIPW